ncbi:MAG: hypothetical protein HN564_03000, partial [Flavobacteriales bacterium]|nr:hypothetical protein [Flavobacteriales bacterium]
VEDIVDGLYKCAPTFNRFGGKNHGFHNKLFKAEIFELGRGKNFSINEIVNLYDTEKRYIPARKGEYPTTLCDYSKAKKVLGWIPTRNLEDYISNQTENE